MAMTSGCATMVPAWKPNSSTTVAISPSTDQGFSLATKSLTARGERLASTWRVAMPAPSGSTT